MSREGLKFLMRVVFLMTFRPANQWGKQNKFSAIRDLVEQFNQNTVAAKI